MLCFHVKILLKQPLQFSTSNFCFYNSFVCHRWIALPFSKQCLDSSFSQSWNLHASSPDICPCLCTFLLSWLDNLPYFSQPYQTWFGYHESFSPPIWQNYSRFLWLVLVFRTPVITFPSFVLPTLTLRFRLLFCNSRAWDFNYLCSSIGSYILIFSWATNFDIIFIYISYLLSSFITQSK